MSHIFDALQKSTAERSGDGLPPALLATELLEIVERNTAAERAKTAVCDVPAQQPFEGNEALAGRPDPVAGLTSISELSTGGTDQFAKFQSLQVPPLSESKLVCINDKESLAAEKFRFVAVRLRHLRQTRLLKKVLITSTIPQEGKTTVAANLACTLAQRTQQKTLLLDGDLRRPALTQLFGLGNIAGMCEWLRDDLGPMPNIYHLEGAGLWLLPAGSPPGTPMELMQSGKVSALMNNLSSWFDWIVIDSPPVLSFADTSIWMRMADGIILVTRQGTTEKRALQRGLEAIEPAKLLGALINGSANVAHSRYYYPYPQPVSKSPDEDLDHR